MLRMIVKRLLFAVPSLIGVVIVTFLLTRALPGDPAAYFAGPAATKEAIEQIRVTLGLDKPLITQFGRYVGDLARGDLGTSLTTGQPVVRDIRTRLPASAELTLLGLIVSILVAVPLGILAATRPGSIVDHVCRVVATAGVSLPVFFTGLISLELFSYKWPIFPNVQYVSFTTNPLEWARNLILPWIVLAFLYAALYARLTRAGMLETMSEDYIRTARAKGLPERKVIVKHGLRAALTPIVTIFGMDLGLLLGGAIITEVTFSLKGLGLFTVEAIQNQDLPEILGVTMLAAFFIVIANLVVDIFYAVLDPRVRY